MGVLRPIKTGVKQFLRRNGLSLNRTDELTRLADEYGSDKGTRLSSHGYTRVYSRLFERIRRDEIILLEMGLLRTDMDGRRPGNAAEGATEAACSRAPSLEMWHAFFPMARIYGFDIDDFSSVVMDKCTTVCGKICTSAVDLDRLVQAIGKPIDIVLYDASHASHHQQIRIGIFIPLRAAGRNVHHRRSSLARSSA